MKRALIHAGKICQVVPAGAEFPVAPELQWVDCPDDTDANVHVWDGQHVTPRQVTKQERNAARLSNMATADQKSIRGIREFLIAKFGSDPLMPAQLSAQEAVAKADRAALEP